MVKSKDIDFTSAPLLKSIILFTLPIIFTNVLQQFFNVADVIVIGQFGGGDTSLSAVSSNGAIISFIVTSLIGISIGLNIVMSRSVGNRDYEYASKAMHTALLFAAIVGVVVAVLGFFFAGAMISLTNLAESIFSKAELYLKVYFLGAPALMIYNFGAAALQSKGDSKTPLYFMIISGVTNLGLNLLFVLCFDMDVLGVAVATVVSEALSAVLIVIKLFCADDFTKLKLKELRFHKTELKDVLKNGLPSMINAMCFSVSNLIIQTAVNGMGDVVTTANSVAQNIEAFSYQACYAFHTTAVTAVSQNRGAGKYDRIKKAVALIVACVAVVGVAVSTILYLFGPQLCEVFSKNPETIVEDVLLRMKLVMMFMFLCGIMDCGAGSLRGLGYSTIATVVSLIGACVFRIIWIYTVFNATSTLYILYISYPISYALTIVAHYAIFAFAYKRQKARFEGSSKLLKEKENHKTNLE